MVKRNNTMRLGAIGVLCLSAVGLTGMSDVSTSIKMSAYVPLVCNVGFNANGGTYNESGVIQLGSTQEFCNSGRGYRIYATAYGTDTGASLIVGNNSYSVTNGQEIMVADISGPARTSRNIYLDAGEGQGGGNLSIRIEAN